MISRTEFNLVAIATIINSLTILFWAWLVRKAMK